MVKSLPLRNEVAAEETWNLADLFATEEDYQNELASLQQTVDLFAAKWQGTITTAEHISEALKAYEDIYARLDLLSNYVELATSVDNTDDGAQMRGNAFGSFIAKVSSQLTFVDSALAQMPEATLREAMKINPQFTIYLQDIITNLPHQLQPEVEKTLAALSSSLASPYALYETSKLVDMSFDDFIVDGEKYPLSYVSFEGAWDSHKDYKKRHAAFDAFYNKLKEYEFTTAKAYDTQVQTEKTLATLRGHESVIDYLLLPQKVDRAMYNRQIDVIMSELAPHMRRYAKLLQKVHGIEEMSFADLKISLDPTYDPQVTVEESKKYIFDALAIMGDDYGDMLRRAYDERWIDFAQNKGKSTGAFCASPYSSHSYILISWTGSMEDVFVLAHELGHAGHFYNAQRQHSLFNSEASLYFIEAPSTMNEMLVANHLLKNSQDPKFKRWVISNIISRTYYHNFVTHLLEAAYQREVYTIVDNGGSVNANTLNKLKRQVLEQFWGEDVKINDGVERTWMRQPHYYMGLYPYTYSAGLTIATEVSQRILHEGDDAVQDWLKTLQAGGTKTPLELAKMAKVDISTEEPLRNTIAYIGSLVDELEKLTAEIDE